MAVLTLMVGGNKTTLIERLDNIEKRLDSAENYLDKDVKRIETESLLLGTKIDRVEKKTDDHKKEYLNLYERFLRFSNKP